MLKSVKNEKELIDLENKQEKGYGKAGKLKGNQGMHQ